VESCWFNWEDFLEAGDEAFQAKRYEQALNWYERSSRIAPTQATLGLVLGRFMNSWGNPKAP
jgi:predicted Zn-dependent protease